MRTFAIFSAASLLTIRGVEAALPFKPVIPRVPPVDDDIHTREAAVPYNFMQPIDHSNPSLGTFPMRYWYNATYWKGPGSPVILMTPGELAADGYTGYLTDRTMPGLIAKAVGGAVVLVEHRYWGTSQPYDIHDTKTLQQLTLENSVADFANFAKSVQLPFDKNASSNAPQAPWIWSGGSYSGALAAWVDALAPGAFHAYHSSSGPVEAMYDYWGYFLPLQRGMPRNCSADLTAIVDYVDDLFTRPGADPREQAKVRQMFGLEKITHADDFTSALGYPLGMWQGIQLYEGYSGFFAMCDAIEGVSPGSAMPSETAPGPEGVGLTRSLANFGKWFKEKFLPGTCQSFGYADWQDPLNVDCFDSYNTSNPIYTDWAPDNVVDRAWFWMTCNQPFFYWQSGTSPRGTPMSASIVSRLVTPEYYQRQCELFFPPVDGAVYSTSPSLGARAKNAAMLNSQTGGWMYPVSGAGAAASPPLDDPAASFSIALPPAPRQRIVWTNGEFDPWRSAGVSSELRPGGPLASDEAAGKPVYLIKGARHCNDLLVKNAQASAEVQKTQDGVLRSMKAWVAEFYKDRGIAYDGIQA